MRRSKWIISAINCCYVVMIAVCVVILVTQVPNYLPLMEKPGAAVVVWFVLLMVVGVIVFSFRLWVAEPRTVSRESPTVAASNYLSQDQTIEIIRAAAILARAHEAALPAEENG